MLEADLDISVLIPTHNRAGDLAETLAAIARCDRKGIRVEIVVCDNASTDNTREVAEDFARTLPVRYFFVPRAGKNHALNQAVETVPMGRIVLLTDDDVTPQPNWFQAVLQAADRHPDVEVFGGKQTPLWPDVPVPGWIRQGTPWVAYGLLDLGAEEQDFPDDLLPNGANYWVRREVFQSGMRYELDVGGDRGSETDFLLRLQRSGRHALYVPAAAIFHRVQPELLTPRSIYRRAARKGRHVTGCYGPAMGRLLLRHPVLWHILAWGYIAGMFLLRTLGNLIPTGWGFHLAVMGNHRLARVVSSLQIAQAYRARHRQSQHRPAGAEEKRCPQ